MAARSDKSEIQEKMVHVARCTKVVKGGRKFSFSAIVVVGNSKGKCGIGLGKAGEVGDARLKATDEAIRSMVKVPLRDGRTIHHEIESYFGACKIVMRPAPSGTGIIAGGAVRSILEVLGVKDIVVKCIGSTNPHNALKAAQKALLSTRSPRAVAERRGKSVAEILCSVRSGDKQKSNSSLELEGDGEKSADINVSRKSLATVSTLEQ